MKVRVDYFPVTDASVLTYITLQFNNKDLQFQSKEGVQKAIVNIYGRITTMTRRMAVSTFEDTVDGGQPGQHAAGLRQAEVDLSEAVAAEARDLPAERGGQGPGGRQHEQLRSGPHGSADGLRKAVLRAP